MITAAAVFKDNHAGEWTLERIVRLTVLEIKQLRDNAERLMEPGIVELCTRALKERPRAGVEPRASSSPRTRARRLVARTRAFEARGVYLVDRRTSWGGVRKSDGGVVLALWATQVLSAEGSCRYLLWAPTGGADKSWSDSAAGQERLQHCKKAMELGRAEGLLVYGEALEGHIPEEKARAIHGVDAELVLAIQVEKVDGSYWAVWGKADR